MPSRKEDIMAEIVREPEHEHVVHHTDGGSSSSVGLLIGVVLVIVLAFLFIYYGLPMIRSAATPSVAVPEQVDVNVNSR
jgi:hypothetical protein